MPCQERVRAHDGADFLEHAPPQMLRFGGQADALIVGEAQPTRAELLAEHAVLGLEIVDDLALLLVDPACERDNEEPEWVRQRKHEAQLADQQKNGLTIVQPDITTPTSRAGVTDRGCRRRCVRAPA